MNNYLQQIYNSAYHEAMVKLAAARQDKQASTAGRLLSRFADVASGMPHGFPTQRMPMTDAINTVSKAVKPYAQDVIGYKPGSGVAGNAARMAWSTFAPGWGKAAERGARAMGASPRAGKAVNYGLETALFAPTLGYAGYNAYNGIKGYIDANAEARSYASKLLEAENNRTAATGMVNDTYNIARDNVRKVAGPMLTNWADGRLRRLRDTYVTPNLPPKMTPEVRDTLEGMRDHGILTGLARHYVYGRTGLGGNRLDMVPDARDVADRAVGSVAKDLTHNFLHSFKEVPNWHKNFTTVSSPLQRVVRPMMPADSIPDIATRAVMASGVIDPQYAPYPQAASDAYHGKDVDVQTPGPNPYRISIKHTR